jgi:hypothetical protein
LLLQQVDHSWQQHIPARSPLPFTDCWNLYVHTGLSGAFTGRHSPPNCVQKHGRSPGKQSAAAVAAKQPANKQPNNSCATFAFMLKQLAVVCPDAANETSCLTESRGCATIIECCFEKEAYRLRRLTGECNAQVG